MQTTHIFPLNSNKRPAVPQDTDWRDYKGEVDTPMIGVMIPQGVVVFDLDTHKGVNRNSVSNALGCRLDWNDALLQQTPSGGQHYAFRVPHNANIPNSVNALQVIGFDIRSSGKGYIATGEGYTDETLIGVIETLAQVELIPELPLSALKMLVRETSESDDLTSLIAAQPLDLTDEEIESTMDALNPSHAADSNTWLKVGMALSHQFGGSEEGWELFDEFSRKALKIGYANYDEKQNRKRYDSFAKHLPANPTTFASVIELAGGRITVSDAEFSRLCESIEDAGSKRELTEAIEGVARTKLDEVDLITITSLIKTTFKSVMGQSITDANVRRLIRKSKPKAKGDYYEDYIYLTSTNEYMHRETKAKIQRAAFNVMYDRSTPPDPEGIPQSAGMYTQNLIDYVYRDMYAPRFDDVFTYDGIDYFNTYRPTVHAEVVAGEAVQRVKAHIAHLLPCEREQRLVIDYLAHNVQFQGKKIFWAMILQGVQGDGKSFLAEMMKHVLGHSNCKSINVDVLDEKYTGWSEGSCMVFIEELKLDNYKKYEVLNKLKPYITNPMISVRRMRTDTYETLNTVNYFALTNFKDAIPIASDDRRYCVLFSQWQSREDLLAWKEKHPDYYKDLYDMMRENIPEIYTWLMNHKISQSFLDASEAPQTEAKTSMINLAKSEPVMLVEEAIEVFKCDQICDDVLNATLLARLADLDDTGVFENFPKTNKLKNALLSMGYHYIGEVKDERRYRAKIYSKQPHKDIKKVKLE